MIEGTYENVNLEPGEFRLPSRDALVAAHLRIVVINGKVTHQLCETLQSFGFESHYVRSAEEAIVYLAQANGTIGVLFDVQPLITGGMTILTELCALYPQVPVITMAAKSQVGLLRQSIKAGAAEYLITPIDHEVLRMKCAYVFFHRKASRSGEGGRRH